MGSFFGLVKRNMLVYLKNKATVFFSLLSPLIILFLYVMFLKQNYIDSLNNVFDSMNEGLTAQGAPAIVIKESFLDSFVNSWLISGILASTFITVPLSSLTLMVTDIETKKDFDFKSSPVKRWIHGMSYLVASFLNTLIISLVIFGIGLVVINTGEAPINIITILKCLLGIVIGSLSGSGCMYMIVSWFKKSSAVGAFTGIVSAASGFLIGAYMPISMFDTWLQYVANTLPGSHVAGIFRNLLMDSTLEQMSKFVPMVAREEFLLSMHDAFSLKLNFYGHTIGESQMWLYASLTLVLILAADIFIYLKTSKRK